MPGTESVTPVTGVMRRQRTISQSEQIITRAPTESHHSAALNRQQIHRNDEQEEVFTLTQFVNQTYQGIMNQHKNWVGKGLTNERPSSAEEYLR